MDKHIALDNPVTKPFDITCTECQATWFPSFGLGCTHQKAALVNQHYCESCGVVPLHSDNERYCAGCVDEILWWLWNEDQQHLMEVIVFEEDYQYSKGANNG